MRVSGSAFRKNSGAQDGGRRKKDTGRLARLLVCLLIFAAVFVGRGVFPQRIAQVRQQVLALIGADLDVRTALEALGSSFGGGGSVLNGLGEFYTEVFGPGRVEEPHQTAAARATLDNYTRQEIRFLSSKAGGAAQAAHFLRLEQLPREWQVTEADRQAAQPAEEPEPAPAVAAVGTVILKADYTGKELPAKYTMDELSLGALETTAPLKGTVHSTYGYRDHPINGKYKFHGGLDIGGQKGDPILAFAGGTVEYIGENDSYGLYIQLDHGNGVKSFYAHCSKLYVSKGDTVSLGERIAAVGSTGAATGPHLHFELKCCGTHVDPAYYL